MGLVKSDWNRFKLNSEGDPQNHFEWLCYLLFCKRYNMKEGIGRFIDQTAIESNPIKRGEEFIGFQAKFYDKTTLSSNKDVFIKMIDDASEKHQNITKIIIYTNQDWGEGKKANEPIAKKEIDKHALKNKIKIDWKTESFFESPFVVEENKIIAEHFFGDKI